MLVNISLGCCICFLLWLWKPQFLWLKTIQIYSFVILEVSFIGLKKVSAEHFPSGWSREGKHTLLFSASLFSWAPKSLQMVTEAMKLRHLLLGRKAMTNLDSILKSRDVTLPTKVRLVKAMVFPVVMYGCESWTIMKAEHWRIDAFELWCWRRVLRIHWTARRSNQSILEEISPEYSLERLMLTPILWLPDAKNRLIGKDPDARKDWRKKEKGTAEDEMVGWHYWFNQWTWVWANSKGYWRTGKLGVLQSTGLQRVWNDWVNKNNW